MQLSLPRALREAQNRQQLSSLALLGQEFWRYPMASPKLSLNTSPTQTSLKTESSGIGTTVFSTNNPQTKSSITPNHTVSTAAVFSPSSVSHPMGLFSQAGTPSDTNSSLSSFTSNGGGQQILSPESIDSVTFASPVESAARIGVIGKTSTFKAQNRKSLEIIENRPSPNPFHNGNHLANGNSFMDTNENGNGRTARPTPPCTLNLAPLRYFVCVCMKQTTFMYFVYNCVIINIFVYIGHHQHHHHDGLSRPHQTVPRLRLRSMANFPIISLSQLR